MQIIDGAYSLKLDDDSVLDNHVEPVFADRVVLVRDVGLRLCLSIQTSEI